MENLRTSAAYLLPWDQRVLEKTQPDAPPQPVSPLSPEKLVRLQGASPCHGKPAAASPLPCGKKAVFGQHSPSFPLFFGGVAPVYEAGGMYVIAWSLAQSVFDSEGLSLAR